MAKSKFKDYTVHLEIPAVKFVVTVRAENRERAEDEAIEYASEMHFESQSEGYDDSFDIKTVKIAKRNMLEVDVNLEPE